MRSGTSQKMDASGIVYQGICEFTGIVIGMDGTNDVSDLTLYDGLTALGTEITPTCGFEADYKGYNGISGLRRLCRTGLYLDFTCAGAAEVIVYFTPI